MIRFYNVALKMKSPGVTLLPFDPKRKPGNSVIETDPKIVFVKIIADLFSVVSEKEAVFYLFFLDENPVAAFPFEKVEYITSCGGSDNRKKSPCDHCIDDSDCDRCDVPKERR